MARLMQRLPSRRTRETAWTLSPSRRSQARLSARERQNGQARSAGRTGAEFGRVQRGLGKNVESGCHQNELVRACMRVYAELINEWHRDEAIGRTGDQHEQGVVRAPSSCMDAVLDGANDLCLFGPDQLTATASVGAHAPRRRHPAWTRSQCPRSV
jgi:hypothetical protein